MASLLKISKFNCVILINHISFTLLHHTSWLKTCRELADYDAEIEIFILKSIFYQCHKINKDFIVLFVHFLKPLLFGKYQNCIGH